MSAKSKDTALNSNFSLNWANRIKNIAKIADENKMLLDKLSNTQSFYEAWKF